LYSFEDKAIAIGIQSVDVLLFEENSNVQPLQLPCVFQSVYRVSGKPADRLGEDHADFPVTAILYHPVE